MFLDVLAPFRILYSDYGLILIGLAIAVYFFIFYMSTKLIRRIFSIIYLPLVIVGLFAYSTYNIEAGKYNEDYFSDLENHIELTGKERPEDNLKKTEEITINSSEHLNTIKNNSFTTVRELKNMYQVKDIDRLIPIDTKLEVVKSYDVSVGKHLVKYKRTKNNIYGKKGTEIIRLEIYGK